MSRAGRKVLIAAAAFALVGAYLGYTGARSSIAYYLTVGELLDRGAALTGSDIRLSGKVVADGMRWDQVSGNLRFVVTDGTRSLPVRYRGVVPDTFRPGADVVVEGRFDGQAFTAERLFAKCPSKFEAKRGS